MAYWKTAVWFRLLTDQISLNCLLVFVNFGHVFYCLKSMFLSEATTSHCKKNSEIIFAALCLYLHLFKKCVSDF